MARKSALERYCTKVISGKEVACKEIKKVCQRLLDDIATQYKDWHFDIEAAERPVNFIERFCKVPSGRLGTPLVLEEYEKAWIEAIFGFVDDNGLRRYQEALINVARKNGKTTLVAAIELYMLVADGEGSPQVYNTATNLDQATLGFNAAWKMVRQSKEIAAHVQKKTGQLYCDMNFGYIMPLASNTTTLDGLDVHCGVLDEIHAMKDRDIYDLIKQGTGAREQPLILQITTNGFVRNSIYDSQIEYAQGWLDRKIDDDRFIAFLYKLDDREEWTDEKCWKKANPGLGTVKQIDYLRNQVKKARQDSTYRPTVMTKDFNMPENAAVAWLDFAEAVNEFHYFGPKSEDKANFRDLGIQVRHLRFRRIGLR